jgi:hypothetical protein
MEPNRLGSRADRGRNQGSKAADEQRK